MKTVSSQFNASTLITPAFPNWQRSFISGKNSVLFSVEHRLSTQAGITLISKVDFKTNSEGPPGHVHGGASAALIDEVMGILVWNQNHPSVTQSLNLQYLKPVPLNITAYLITRLTKESDKKIEVDCQIINESGVALVRAQGSFHKLTQDQLNHFVSKM